MNPHHETAQGLLSDEYGAAGTHLDPNTQGMMLAQTEATLAIAYEQRTANLIAMYTDGASGTVPGIDYSALVKQISERLGLA
jgi:hypothetical protein